MPRRKRNRKSGQNNGVQNGVPATESHDPVISQAIAMGLQSQQAGNLHQAELIYKKVLTADPSNAEAYRLLGALSYEKGEPAAAILLIQKAIAIKPNMADSYCNLADAQRSLGQTDEAIANCRKALSLRPNFPEALNNLGINLQGHGDISGAVFYHKKAIALDRKNAQYRCDLGTTLRRDNQNEEAISCFRKALEIKPDHWDAYYKLNQTLKSEGHDNLEEDIKRLRREIENTPTDPISSPANKEVGSALHAMENVVALITAGRAGSFFFHSLFDSHPEIWTTPGVYLKGFFEKNVWETLSGVSGPTNNYKVLVEKFSDHYDVLFDARSSNPVFGNPMTSKENLGRASGLATMDEDQTHSLSLDRKTFKDHLLKLLSLFKQVDSKIFFKLIHLAYNETLNLHPKKSALFYHIHNPDFEDVIQFLGLFKNARLIQIIREPLQTLESQLYQRCPTAEKQKILQNILGQFSDNMLDYPINQHILELYKEVAGRVGAIFSDYGHFAFNFAPAMVVRLEDVKKRPRKLMPLIADWIGIKDHENLYTPTFQGHYYWGPDSALSPQLKGFDSSNIDRKAGVFFSERDQFIFKTLLYPARVRFGYQEEDPEGHRRDLKKIKPLLDEPLDLEVKLYNMLRHVSTPLKRLNQYQDLHLNLNTQFTKISKNTHLSRHLTNQFEIA